MRFGILGPLEVWDDARQVAVGGPQQRGLLAILLLNANRVVSSDRLIEYLWTDEPPPTARGLLQGCVAGLRRVLRLDSDGAVRQPLLTRSPGYLLEVRPGELDLDRFEELVQTAESTSDIEQTAALLDEALSLWRGSALADIHLEVCQVEAAGLEERRTAVLEDRIDVDLRLGGHGRLAGDLQVLVRAHPLRERLWAQLMLASYAAGRQADALSAYGEVRQILVERLGVEPGTTLRAVHQSILSGGDALTDYLSGGRRPSADEADEVDATVAPAPSSGTVVPAQLPATTAAFTGRARDQKRLDELLADDGGGSVPIGVVSGTAGVGKTALAVHWAHRVRDRFPDGQLYVDLRGYAPAPALRPVEALAGFLRALDVSAEQVPVDVEQATGLYRTLLADRRVLVLLDNAHSVEQVRPLLPGNPGWSPGTAPGRWSSTSSIRRRRPTCSAASSARSGRWPSRRRSPTWPGCVPACRWRCGSPRQT